MQSLLGKNSLHKDDKRHNILELLSHYSQYIHKKEDIFYKEQKTLVDRIIEFVLNTSQCFYRESAKGHITGSAFIVNHDFTHCLMTEHKKLKKWIQLGGHADGHPLIYNVSLKEAQEESGLNDFEFLDIKNFPRTVEKDSALPFDVDIHMIPKSPFEEEHYHYDIRFLLKTSQAKKTTISSESLDLKWIPLEKVKDYSSELSTMRQVMKAKALIGKLIGP